MADSDQGMPELINWVKLLERCFEGTGFAHFLARWENIIFSLFAVICITIFAYMAARKKEVDAPGKLQNIGEILAGGIDDFVCGILGPKGRKFTPFIGTLFMYILFMNLIGLIPFMKSATASWSITLPMALCVFFYVQYTAVKELGFFGYIDHLMERPRGIMAMTVVMPLFMFFIHLIGELVKPLTLSLRLRSNIWGDDLLLAIMTGYGFPAMPILFFNTLIVLMAGIVQTVVFCLLTTVYFALVMPEEH